jgi:hypothetical protein
VLKLDRQQQRFVNVPLPYQGTLFGVVGTNNAVVVFGLRGNAFRTTDGGASWTKLDTGVGCGPDERRRARRRLHRVGKPGGPVLLSTDDGAASAASRLPGGACVRGGRSRQGCVAVGRKWVRTHRSVDGKTIGH